MWAFAIYDIEKRSLFISRDRFGIKPLYYYHNHGVFAFASEIKSLLEVNFIDSKLNMNSAFQYMFYGSISDISDTYYEEIHELEPGTNLFYSVEENFARFKKYYNLSDVLLETHIETDERVLINKYKTHFSQSIDLHMRSDVPVGACLSGGLDSSGIVAYASKLLNRDLFNTFTTKFNEPEIDESHFVELIAKENKLIRPFYTTPTIEGFMKVLDKIIWHQDVPFHGFNMIAQWEVMRLASQNNIKVLLDGQGADEALGGYRSFAGILLIDQLRNFQFRRFLNNVNNLKRNRSINILMEVA